MTERLPTNSETLKKAFPQVYRDFFASCQQVASASNSFLWTGEFSGFYGGLTVSQKLPIRSYVGLETTFEGEVAINREYLTFDGAKQQFVKSIVDDRLCENLTQYLIKHYQGDKNFTGVRIHILTEIPLGHSLGSNGAIAAALALLLAKKQKFDTVFARAREILSLSQAGHSSGVSAYMALANTPSPVVFFTKDGSYVAKPIDELAGLATAPIWPIDFGLIYTGAQANAESVILANNQTVAELSHITNSLDQLLGKHQKFNFQRTYIDILNITAGLTASSLVEMLKRGADNPTLERFFNSLNQYQNLLHVLHVSDSLTDLLYSRIHQIANKQVNEVGSGAKISGIGKGGALLFAVPYGTHRSSISELVAKLAKETGRPLWLDYTSWLDGIGGQPGKIEQDIASGIHSSFIDRDALSLVVLEQGKMRKQVLTNERFESFKNSLDLLLDKTTGKIMIAGQSVTSKELPSQKATVAIFANLISTNGLMLQSADLPSSYGENRYDLQGKIVLPLIKQVKALTGRDLQLTISGKMYENYRLSLDPSNITIGILEKKH